MKTLSKIIISIILALIAAKVINVLLSSFFHVTIVETIKNFNPMIIIGIIATLMVYVVLLVKLDSLGVFWMLPSAMFLIWICGEFKEVSTASPKFSSHSSVSIHQAFSKKEKVSVNSEKLMQEKIFLTEEKMIEKKPLIYRASKESGLDEELIASVITFESTWNPRAISNTGCVGYMQLSKRAAREMGLKVDTSKGVDERKHPEKNIIAGAKYLAKMIKKAKSDLSLGLAYYSKGRSASNDTISQAQREYSAQILALRSEL